MKYDDLVNLLSEKQKTRLREAKTNEDLDSLFTADEQQLTEDQLGEVAGGTSCFTPDPMRTLCLSRARMAWICRRTSPRENAAHEKCNEQV